MEFIEPFISTYVYKFLSIIITALWSSPIGQIFLVTAVLYGVGYTVYAGYLTYFARGLGGLSLSQLGFHPSDLITMFPAIILTLSKVVWSLFTVLMIYAIGSGVTLIIGVFLGQLIRSYIIAPLAPASVLASVIYFIGLLLPLFLSQTGFSRRRLFVTAWVLQLISIITFFVTNDPASQPQQPISSPLLGDSLLGAIIATIMLESTTLIAIVVLLPSMFLLIGVNTAEIALRENFLSQIMCLSLKQPLPSFSQFQKIEPESNPKSTLWREKWFIKSTVNVVLEPSVYSYLSNDETPKMYLVASFRDFTIIHIHSPEASPEANLVLISNEIVYSIDLQSRQLMDPL